MAHQNEHLDAMSPHLGGTVKTIINWLAAALGIGSAADLVPVLVGVLSAGWILVQLWGYLWYELPRKRLELEIRQARLDGLRRGYTEDREDSP